MQAGSTMKKSSLNRTLRLAGTLLAFGLVVYLLMQQGWDQILAGVRSIPAWRFAAALALMLVSRLAVAVRWHTLLAAARQKIPLTESLRITFAGLFASNFLPTTIGGDVVRLAMAIRIQSDKLVSAASLVVDRLVGMAGMGTMALAGLIFLIPAANLAEAGIPALVGAAWFESSASFLRKSLKRLWEALALWLRAPAGLLWAYLWTWVHQFCIYGVTWLMLDGLGEGPSYWLVGGLWSLTYFLTLLPVSINGLGLQELSMTAIFSTMGGVSVSSAATAALLVRTLQMLASVPGAAFLPDILRLQERQRDASR
jgi:uncharacterized membrane protein YbhN (UPF0104 family)